MLNLAVSAFGQEKADHLSFTLPLLHDFVILPLLCRDKMWSIGFSPRNAA